MNKEIKKFVLVTGTAFTMAGCFEQRPPQTNIPPIVAEASPKQDQLLVLASMHQEIIRLSQTYPADSTVKQVYLGNLADLSPVFRNPLKVGITDPSKVYATTGFINAEYSTNPRFRYTHYEDGSIPDYQTLESMDINIYFSPLWLNSKNDAVKKIALEKEAYALSLWEPFSRIVLNTYLSQGRIDIIDKDTTEAEIARTLAIQLIIENEGLRKMYDYAGYLAVLPKVGNLLDLQNPDIQRELNYSNLPTIYELAQQNGVDFENLEFGSREFLELAFDLNGPWAKMILDPSVPGPSSVY